MRAERARPRLVLIAAALLLLAGPLAAQTTVTINNLDSAGVGFNDTTPVAVVGGNTGTTRGQQRMNAFKFAANLWASRLKSNVPIVIDASFAKLECTATQAVLAQAGTSYIFSDFAGAPLASTWYPFSLANALAGSDLYPGTEQVDAQFNAAIEDGSCSFPNKWYYGLDRLPPSSMIEFVTVAEHELGHGLGFQSFVDPTDGSLQPDDTGIGLNDVFSSFLLDGTTGKGWGAMTNAERAKSATNNGNLLWNGPAATAKARTALSSGTGTGGRVKLYAPTTVETGSSVSHWDTSLTPNELMEPYYTTLASPAYGLIVTAELMNDLGWPSATAATPTFGWLLPSSANVAGANGAFYTTSLSVGNRDTKSANVAVKFLGNNADGTSGPSVSWAIPAGQAIDVSNVLSSVFGLSNAFGAIEITADTSLLDVTSQTSTPATGGGTFGQSVPGIPEASFIRQGSSGQIAGIREDGSFRSNLVLANATSGSITVHGELYDVSGTRVGSGADWPLQPLGMTQVSHVAQSFTSAPVVAGRIVLTTATAGGAFAAYASAIDNTTNDPRTLLAATASEPLQSWLLPSSAHSSGAGGAFYTTDLLVTNTGASSAAVTLQVLGHDANGVSGPALSFANVPAGSSLFLQDVLGSFFGLSSGYGAIRVTSTVPTLAVTSQTSTPATGGGTYGQSVPGVPASSLLGAGAVRTLVSLREDAAFRTNLILANGSGVPVTVHGDLISGLGAKLASGDWTIPPWTMTQVTRVIHDLMGPAAQLTNGILILSTTTVSGSFAAYASEIDNVTNDPRTILPQ